MYGGFNVKIAKQLLERFKSEAEKKLGDPDKVRGVLKRAMKKADYSKGPMEKVFQDLQLMSGIIKDYISGEYREIPKGTIIAILGALIYLVSPIDAIPDALPVVGYIDDVFIIDLVIKQVYADLDKYRLWKENKR